MEAVDDGIGEADRLVLEGLRSAGKAWIVGGWVREALSGRKKTDIDIATTLLPSEVKELFPRSLMVGAKYGTVMVRLNESLSDNMWEVTTLRKEGSYGDGRRPDQVEFGQSIEGDLARRDFTINAMAIDSDGDLIDPFDGHSDLKEGILRAVGYPLGDPAVPGERLGEDGLRIMRAYRFLDSADGMRSMEGSLRSAVKDNLEMLDVVSRERIGVEMMRILGGGNPGEVVSQMLEDGVMGRVMPEIACTAAPSFCEDSIVNLALLCSDEPSEGGDMVTKLRSALVLAKHQLRLVAFLHDARGASLSTEVGGLRRFRAALPAEWRSAFTAYSLGLGRDTEEFSGALESLSPLIAGNAPLVNGTALVEATGLEPGPRMGRLKGLLHRIQVERDLSTSGEVLSVLDEMDWRDSDYESWPALGWP
uniref:tRNA (Cca) n=1 Tax=uncultured marine group II/III euryarchaeote KM3_12_H08 TaxID=1457862 RepID=A0A075GE54_9EURY|nr:tRNA (cca) [uncultured marine group II/III euryarchaeote KM3_12_H08]